MTWYSQNYNRKTDKETVAVTNVQRLTTSSFYYPALSVGTATVYALLACAFTFSGFGAGVVAEHGLALSEILACIGALAAMTIATIVHELGHLFAAYLVKFPVSRIRIGQGKFLYAFEALGTTWQFHASLSDGMMFYFINKLRFLKYKMVFIALCGPLSSMMLSGLSIALLLAASPRGPQDAGACPLLFSALIGWNAICGIYLVFSFIPFEYTMFAKIHKSDMLRIFLDHEIIPRRSRENSCLGNKIIERS